MPAIVHTTLISVPKTIYVMQLFLLQDFFSKYGKVKHCQLVVDRYTNKSRGFAFIHFEDIEDAIEVCVIVCVNEDNSQRQLITTADSVICSKRKMTALQSLRFRYDLTLFSLEFLP